MDKQSVYHILIQFNHQEPFDQTPKTDKTEEHNLFEHMIGNLETCSLHILIFTEKRN